MSENTKFNFSDCANAAHKKVKLTIISESTLLPSYKDFNLHDEIEVMGPDDDVIMNSAIKRIERFEDGRVLFTLDYDYLVLPEKVRKVKKRELELHNYD